jgi:hypothetical protein
MLNWYCFWYGIKFYIKPDQLTTELLQLLDWWFLVGIKTKNPQISVICGFLTSIGIALVGMAGLSRQTLNY